MRIRGDLERQDRQRLFFGGPAGQLDGFVARFEALDGGYVQRRGQVVDDGVQQRLHTLVLERGTAHHGGERRGQHAAADGGLDLLNGDGVGVLQPQLHELVVVLGDGLQHLGAGQFGSFDHVSGDVRDLVVVEGGFGDLERPDVGFHGDQVHLAPEVRLRADRQLQQHRGGVEAFTDGLDAVIEGGARAVQLVDVADARHTVLGGLAPNGLRLRLNTRDAVEHRHCTVEHTQGALHLDGEVDVSRGVDDVDLDVVPESGGRGGGDGDAAFLLLLHPVHGGGAVVDLADLVGLAGVEEDALGCGGLAGVDVRHDADVANLGQVDLGHVQSFAEEVCEAVRAPG